MKLNELEAIELTIDKGFRGEELELSCWKKKGALDGKRCKVTGKYKEGNMIKFIRKLETLFDSVEVEGKGKKRIYILSGEKTVQSAMQDNRKFNGYDKNDYIMSKYVFNRLVAMDSKEIKSTYQWSVEVGALSTATITLQDVEDHFYDIYLGEDASTVHNGFISTIKNYNRGMVEKAFKYLQHLNLIDVTEHFTAIKLNGEKVAISKDTFDKFTAYKRRILNKYNVSVFGLKYLENSPKYADMNDELNQLYDDMGMKLVFIAQSVQLLSTATFDDVTFKVFTDAYYTQLINKMEKRTYNEGQFLSLFNRFKAFSLLSTLSIVVKDNARLNELVEAHKPSYVDVYPILATRYMDGVKMSQRFLQDQSEMELALSGNTITKVEVEKVEEKLDLTNITIDDVIDWNDITAGTLL